MADETVTAPTATPTDPTIKTSTGETVKVAPPVNSAQSFAAGLLGAPEDLTVPEDFSETVEGGSYVVDGVRVNAQGQPLDGEG